jgi:hypothetical protein
MNPRTSNVAGWIIITLMLCQFIPLDRVNPPSKGTGNLPAGVRLVLQARCGECHSNSTRWPGSAFVAPLSWYVVHEVLQARNEMNFSEFPTASGIAELNAKNRIHALIISGNAGRHAIVPGFASPDLTRNEQELLIGWSANLDKKPLPTAKNSGNMPKVTASKFKN